MTILLAKTPDGASNIGRTTITMVCDSRSVIVRMVKTRFGGSLATGTPNLVTNEALATGRMNSISLFFRFFSRSGAFAKAQTLWASLSVRGGTTGMSSNSRAEKIWAVSIV